MDLRRRVALNHLDWDLSGYQGAGLDYWVDEAPIEVPGGTSPADALEEVRRGEDTSANDPTA